MRHMSDAEIEEVVEKRWRRLMAYLDEADVAAAETLRTPARYVYRSKLSVSPRIAAVHLMEGRLGWSLRSGDASGEALRRLYRNVLELPDSWSVAPGEHRMKGI